jgi:hypothetical protein
MSAWETACKWYSPDEIHRTILAKQSKPHLLDNWPNEPIPADVTSREFAEWLCDQYRLAMAKGIQLATKETEK